MTKRSNPFVEDFIPQSKTHVGLKQFNNNDDRMQNVYEKTLHLLYKGAKKSTEELKIVDAVPSAKRDCMKQLLINKDGILINTKIIDTGKPRTVQLCVCGSLYHKPAACCSYCDSFLCTSCSRLCTRCNLIFCSKCCLLGSEGTDITCVSCYG